MMTDDKVTRIPRGKSEPGTAAKGSDIVTTSSAGRQPDRPERWESRVQGSEERTVAGSETGTHVKTVSNKVGDIVEDLVVQGSTMVQVQASDGRILDQQSSDSGARDLPASGQIHREQIWTVHMLQTLVSQLMHCPQLQLSQQDLSRGDCLCSRVTDVWTINKCDLLDVFVVDGQLIEHVVGEFRRQVERERRNVAAKVFGADQGGAV